MERNVAYNSTYLSNKFDTYIYFLFLYMYILLKVGIYILNRALDIFM